MKYISSEQYDQHDCHLSDEDGCEVCEMYWSQPLVADQTADGIHNEVCRWYSLDGVHELSCPLATSWDRHIHAGMTSNADIAYGK